VEGQQHCVAEGTTSSCESTVDCPPGFHCRDIGGKVCEQLCSPAGGGAPL
jgi:hypothetical protein